MTHLQALADKAAGGAEDDVSSAYCACKAFWIVSSLSHPGNLTKSNSDDLQSSPASTPELHSNKSLYQESDIPLNH